LTSLTLSTAQISKSNIDRSIDIFGLQLNQSIDDITKYLMDSFHIKKEQIKKGKYYTPRIDGLNVDTLTLNNIEVPLQFDINSAPIKIKLKKMEILFTLKIPASKTSSTASKYIVLWFENTPEIQALLKQYTAAKLGAPDIDNAEGYQWCNKVNTETNSCNTSCDVIDWNELCPQNVVVGLGKASPNIYSLAIVDWSMDVNVRKALKQGEMNITRPSN